MVHKGELRDGQRWRSQREWEDKRRERFEVEKGTASTTMTPL
jgi:hypothetical protein